MSGLTPPITQPAAPSDIAQWVMTQTQNTLNDAVTGPMQALFEALMPVIVVGLTLQFVVYAFALMHGQVGMTVTEFFRKPIMVVIISIFFGVRSDARRVGKECVSTCTFRWSTDD